MPTPPADGLIQIDQVFEELLMKMEVLSVQNQFQGQFGVIGSTKAKDWTSPLTPPPPPPPTTRKRSGSSSTEQQRGGQQQQLQNSSNNTQSGDVVDGRQAQQIQHANHHQQQQPQQLQKQQQQHINHLYHNQHSSHPQHAQHPPPHSHPPHRQQQQQLSRAMDAATATAEPEATYRYVYNNNLLCCEPPSPLDVTASSAARFGAASDDVDAAAVNELSQRLQAELRAAKSRHLACTEVSLPWDLTPRIAAEIIKTSEREPCGVRGCTIFIDFEDEPDNTRRIASFNVDPHTVPTFELYLTLKHDKSGWTSLLPQFLKNLTRSSTILISPNFTLTKNKLYACE